MNEFIKRITAVMALSGYLVMNLNAGQIDSSYSKNAEILQSFNEKHEFKVIDQNDFSVNNQSNLSGLTIDNEFVLTDERSSFDNFNIIRKSEIYKILNEIRKQIEENDFLKLTKEELRERWQHDIKEVVAGIKNNDGRYIALDDFYDVEREVFNSLLNNYLYDHNSLRKQSDESNAMQIAEKLCNDLIQNTGSQGESIFVYGDRIVDNISSDKMTPDSDEWFEKMSEEMQKGLSAWNNIEKEFLLAKSNWENTIGNSFAEEVNEWQTAYSYLQDKKEKWFDEFNQNLMEGNALWTERKAKLEEYVNTERINFLNQLSEKYEIRNFKIEAIQYMVKQIEEVIDTAAEGINQWCENWGEVFTDINNCLDNESNFDAVLQLIEEKKISDTDLSPVFLESLNDLEKYINVIGVNRNELNKNFSLLQDLFSKKDDIACKSSSEYELEKIESIEKYLEKQVLLNERLYEYSLNRTSSAEDKSTTEKKYNDSLNKYEAAEENYKKQIEILKNIEERYTESVSKYNEQKIVVSEKLQNLENLQKQYNDLQYGFSEFQLENIEKEIIGVINTLNSFIYDKNEYKKYISDYVNTLQNEEYSKIESNGKQLIEKINNDQVIEVNGESIEVTGLQKIKETIALKIRNNEDYSYEQQILDKSNEIIDFVLTGESTDPEIVSEYKVSSLQYYIKKDSTAIEKVKNIIEKYDKSKNEDLSVQKITELKGELEELKNDDVSQYVVSVIDIYIDQLINDLDYNESNINKQLSDMGFELIIADNKKGSQLYEDVIRDINPNNFETGDDSVNSRVFLDKIKSKDSEYHLNYKNLMNLIQNYQNIQSKYELYFSDKDKLLNNLMNAEKEYNHELEKINISSEDGLYSDALNLYKIYECQIKEVQKAAENKDEAAFDLQINEEIYNWAKNTYLHSDEGSYSNLELKTNYEKAVLKLDLCKKLKDNINNTENVTFNQIESEYLKEYKDAAEKLCAFEFIKEKVSSYIYNKSEEIKRLEKNYDSCVSKLIKETDLSELDEDSVKIPDIVQKFVCVIKDEQDAENPKYTIKLKTDDELNDYSNNIISYVSNKNICIYNTDGSVSYHSKAFFDVQNFLLNVNNKEYNLDDLLMSVSYLIYESADTKLYGESENPLDANNYSLGIPTDEILGLKLNDIYTTSRIEEIHRAYDKVVENNGSDDIAKFILYSNFNINPDFQLEKQRVDIISYRGLQGVIDKLYETAVSYRNDGIKWILGATMMSSIAAIPAVGAWAIVPCSILLACGASCFTSASSLEECASDVSAVQRGYSEINNEYKQKYNKLTNEYWAIEAQLSNEKKDFQELTVGFHEGLFNFEDFCHSIEKITGNSTILKDSKVTEELFNSVADLINDDNINLETVTNLFYKEFLKQFNDIEQKISEYIVERDNQNAQTVVLLSDIEQKLLTSENVIADLDQTYSVLKEISCDKLWNKNNLLSEMNHVLKQVLGDKIVNNVNCSDSYLLNKQKELCSSLMINNINSLQEVNDVNLFVKETELNARYEKWLKDVNTVIDVSNLEWNKSERMISEEYEKWKLMCQKQYSEKINEIEKQYNDLQNKKLKWLEDQYSGEAQKLDDDILTDFSLITEQLNPDTMKISNLSLTDLIKGKNTVLDELLNYSLQSASEKEYDKCIDYHITKLQNYIGLADTYNLIDEKEKELNSLNIVYSNELLKSVVLQKKLEIESRLNESNLELSKWQEDLVRREGYSVGDEISRYAVVDSLVFNNAVREKQTVHKYEWFTIDDLINDLVLPDSFSLNNENYNLIVSKNLEELNKIYEKIFGSQNSEGEFSKHVGYAPEFVSNVDIKRGRFENISKNGSGEMGQIMLDFIWNSLVNREGYVQLGTPLYEKKFTSDNKIFGIEIPTIRKISDIICSIAASATGVEIFNYVDDVAYGVMDYSYKRKTLNDFISGGVKEIAGILSNKFTSGLGSAINSISSKGTKIIAKSGLKAGTNYLTSVTNNFIDSIDFEKGFEIDWNKVASGFYGKDTLLNSVSAFGSETFKLSFNAALDDIFTKDGVRKDLSNSFYDTTGVKKINRNLSVLAGAGIEYGLTGKTSLNILSANNLGFNLNNDVGLFELQFDENSVTANISKNGNMVDVAALINSTESYKDALRIWNAKIKANSGDFTDLGIVNGINAAAASQTLFGNIAAQKVWDGEIELNVEKMEALGKADKKMQTIFISDKFIDNNVDAAAQFASLLVHETVHLAEGDEFQARVEGYETFSKLKTLYGISQDVYSNESDVFDYTEIYEEIGKEGLFYLLFSGDSFKKSEDDFEYYLLETKDPGYRQTDLENKKYALGFGRTQEEVDKRNEDTYLSKYALYVDDEYEKYLSDNPDCNLSKEEFVQGDIVEFLQYDSFKKRLEDERTGKIRDKILNKYQFKLEKPVTLYNSGCVVATLGYVAYTANGTLKTMNEINELLKEADLFSYGGDQKLCINYGENYRKAVNLIAGDEVIVGFERVDNQKEMSNFIEKIQNSDEAYICIARVINDSHATMMTSNQEKNAVNEKGEKYIGAITVIDPWGYNYKSIGRSVYALSEVSNITAYKVDTSHRKESLYEKIVQKQAAVW